MKKGDNLYRKDNGKHFGIIADDYGDRIRVVTKKDNIVMTLKKAEKIYKTNTFFNPLSGLINVLDQASAIAKLIPPHYKKQQIDLIKRFETEKTPEVCLEIARFNIDKYNSREKKNQTLSDLDKIIFYAEWAKKLYTKFIDLKVGQIIFTRDGRMYPNSKIEKINDDQIEISFLGSREVLTKDQILRYFYI